MRNHSAGRGFRTRLLMLAMVLAVGSAMYEREVGLKDWVRKQLGDLTDFKFIEESSLAYTLSSDGVVALFDTMTEKIHWQKDLPQDHKSGYQVRYLGRNLLVYSTNRAIMLNSKGHIIFEQQFENKDKNQVAVELFQAAGSIFTCIVAGKTVYVYENYQLVMQLPFSNSEAKPLATIYDYEANQLYVLIIEGKKMTKLKVSVDDIKNGGALQEVAKEDLHLFGSPKKINVLKSLTKLVITAGEQLLVIDPVSLKPLFGFSHKSIQVTTLHDIVLIQ